MHVNWQKKKCSELAFEVFTHSQHYPIFGSTSFSFHCDNDWMCLHYSLFQFVAELCQVLISQAHSRFVSSIFMTYHNTSSDTLKIENNTSEIFFFFVWNLFMFFSVFDFVFLLVLILYFFFFFFKIHRHIFFFFLSLF